MGIKRPTPALGPGLRTTIFLKGCSLACAWCHNPESIAKKFQVHWVAARCIHCGTCDNVCSTGALTRDEDGIHIDRRLCTGCCACVSACPTLALECKGIDAEPEELCRELVKRPEALKYTSTKTRGFRNDTFTMNNHNHLLGQPPGVDGLKTGYFQLAGFSIATTAPKGSQRVITLVMGSSNRKERDTKAMEIMNKALAELPAEAATVQAPPPAPTDPGQVSAPPAGTDTAAGEPQNTAATAPGSQPKGASSGWGKFFLGLGAGIFVFLAIVLIAGRILQQRRDGNRYIHRR